MRCVVTDLLLLEHHLHDSRSHGRMLPRHGGPLDLAPAQQLSVLQRDGVQPHGLLAQRLPVEDLATTVNSNRHSPTAIFHVLRDVREHADLAAVHQEDRLAVLPGPPEQSGERPDLHAAAVLPGAPEAGHVQIEDVLEGLHHHAVPYHVVSHLEERVKIQPLRLLLREVVAHVPLHGDPRLGQAGADLLVVRHGAAGLECRHEALLGITPNDVELQNLRRVGELAQGLRGRGVQAVKLGAIEDKPVDPLVRREAHLLLLEVLDQPIYQGLRRCKEDESLQMDHQHPAVGHVLDLPLHQVAAALQQLPLPSQLGPPSHAGDLGVADDEGGAYDETPRNHCVEQGVHEDEDRHDEDGLQPLCGGQVLP
mmetsp:Transcript_101206/g.294711  ORF Transcript_101206/g.294711 Transcript_101206/m.294711 type:complete len:366 (-) Transcript_101206:467-1564(-)